MSEKQNNDGITNQNRSVEEQLEFIDNRLGRIEAMLFTVLERHETLKQYMGLPEMKDLLSCSRGFIYALVEDGLLPEPYKLRGKTIWKRKEVIPHIEQALTKVSQTNTD